MPENAPRVMPSSIDAEKSVLGAMLLSEDCVLIAVEKLKEEDFYSRDNRRIFAAMVELTGRNLPEPAVLHHFGDVIIRSAVHDSEIILLFHSNSSFSKNAFSFFRVRIRDMFTRLTVHPVSAATSFAERQSQYRRRKIMRAAGLSVGRNLRNASRSTMLSSIRSGCSADGRHSASSSIATASCPPPRRCAF